MSEASETRNEEAAATTPPVHRSKSAGLLPICGGVALVAGASAGLLWACSAKTVTVDVPVAVYVPAGCGDAKGASVTYTGLGDFPQMTAAAEVVTLGSTGVVLNALPSATRQLVVTPVSDAAPWAGSALVPDAGNVSVLTLPLATACPLTVPHRPAAAAGTTMGNIDATHVMLMGGTDPPFVVNLATGTVTQLAAGPMHPSDYATITPFGAGALIAGGTDATQLTAQQFAVVYSPSGPAANAFSGPTQLPSLGRTKHAAVALPDGKVLLVGGTNDLNTLITTIDVFDPASPTTPSTLSATLHTGRVLPTVIALPNGNVFIGGGLDKNGNPIASAEWLKPDLTWLGTQSWCSASVNQGFAATEGGAVLAVMGEAPSPGCSNVHVVVPSGVTDAPPLASTSAPAVVSLFAADQASPVLVSDIGAFTWSPWSGAFTSLGSNAAGLSLPTPAALAPSRGLAMWLGEDGNIWVLRTGTHGEYATDVAHGNYLVTDNQYIAPDQLPDANVGFSVAVGATMTNGATVWLTDATFAELAAGVLLPMGGAATFVLRDPRGDEVTCSVTGASPGASMGLMRSGATVTATVDDAGSAPCVGTLDAGVRVSIGVRGPAEAGTTTVRSLSVTR